MFHKEFYPTPRNLAVKMLDQIPWEGINTVLEPSAGSGALAEAAASRMKYTSQAGRWKRQEYIPDVDAIEIDPNLRHILQGKGIRVVHDDFLTFETCKQYDLILMNPPFSDGDKHLLKAIRMQEKGGQILCLLNAETLKNPYSNSRKDLVRKLEEYGAKVNYMQGAFQNADRKTGVEAALISMQIQKKESQSQIFEELRSREQTRESIGHDTQIMDSEPVKAIVQQYNCEVKTGLKLIEEYRGFVRHSLKNESSLKLDFRDTDRYSDKLNDNEFVRRTRYKYWVTLFENKEFIGLLTSELLNEYRSRIQKLQEYDFSLYNVYTLRCDMGKNLVRGVEETILNLFEELSHKHCWHDEMSKNIHYYNGWKTNSAYKINPKVIIPLNGYTDLGYYPGGYNPTNRGVLEKLSDIEKALNYLDGGIAEELSMEEQLKRAKEAGKTKKVPLKYFNVTFYKKGTCHIEFKNQELLDKLNIFGSQRKNWLPPHYGKVRYQDMSKEEKAVIESFQGEKAYQKVIENPDRYLFSVETIPMLAGTVEQNS